MMAFSHLLKNSFNVLLDLIALGSSKLGVQNLGLRLNRIPLPYFQTQCLPCPTFESHVCLLAEFSDSETRPEYSSPWVLVDGWTPTK